MLYNRCTGIYTFGNNIYPRRIRRRSNLGHIFRGKKCVLWAGKYYMFGAIAQSHIRFHGGVSKRKAETHSFINGKGRHKYKHLANLILRVEAIAEVNIKIIILWHGTQCSSSFLIPLSSTLKTEAAFCQKRWYLMTKLHDVTFNKTFILMQLRIINKMAVKRNNVYCITMSLYE